MKGKENDNSSSNNNLHEQQRRHNNINLLAQQYQQQPTTEMNDNNNNNNNNNNNLLVQRDNPLLWKSFSTVSSFASFVATPLHLDAVPGSNPSHFRLTQTGSGKKS